MVWIKSTKIGLRPMIRPGCKLRQLHHNHQISGYLKKLPSNHQLTKHVPIWKDQWCYFWKIMSFWRQWFLGYLIEKCLGQSYLVKNAKVLYFEIQICKSFNITIFWQFEMISCQSFLSKCKAWKKSIWIGL